jgi:hypothetical protein
MTANSGSVGRGKAFVQMACSHVNTVQSRERVTPIAIRPPVAPAIAQLASVSR